MKKILFFLFLIPFLCEGQTSGVGSVSELQALRTASAKQTGTTLPVLKLVPVTVSGKYEFKSGQFQTPDALKMGFMRKLSDGSYGIAVDGSLIGSGGSGSVTLSNSRTATTFDIIPASGTATTIPAATTSLAGALPAADKVFLDNVPTSLGIAKNATGFGTFTGSTIPDNQSAKGVDQALETAVEARQLGILYEDEFSALGTLGTAVKVAYRGTGLSATRSGDTIIVTSSASSPVQYEDDAAAATGGVAIGSTYYVSASNPYGLPVGAQRVRVAFLLLLGIPMKRRNMNMKKILLSVLMMLFAFVGFSQTNVIGGGGVSKFATTATLKTSTLPSKTGLDISRQAMVLADSGIYDLRGSNWHRTNPIKAAAAPLVYDGVINNADAEWINTTTQLKHKVNTATGKWRVVAEQKLNTLANFPVASSTVETEGVRLISSSDTSAWISKTRTGGVLVWERETHIDSTVTPTAYWENGSNKYDQSKTVWDRPNVSVVSNTIPYVYNSNRGWIPQKGDIYAYELGASPTITTNNASAIQRSCDLFGYVLIDTIYDLGASNLNISNAILRFTGNGQLLGTGTITGTNCKINADIKKIFGTSLQFAGNWQNSEAYPEWWVGSDRSVALNNFHAFKQIHQMNLKGIIRKGAAYPLATSDSQTGSLSPNKAYFVGESVDSCIVLLQTKHEQSSQRYVGYFYSLTGLNCEFRNITFRTSDFDANNVFNTQPYVIATSGNGSLQTAKPYVDHAIFDECKSYGNIAGLSIRSTELNTSQAEFEALKVNNVKVNNCEFKQSGAFIAIDNVALGRMDISNVKATNIRNSLLVRSFSIANVAYNYGEVNGGDVYINNVEVKNDSAIYSTSSYLSLATLKSKSLTISNTKIEGVRSKSFYSEVAPFYITGTGVVEVENVYCYNNFGYQGTAPAVEWGLFRVKEAVNVNIKNSKFVVTKQALVDCGFLTSIYAPYSDIPVQYRHSLFFANQSGGRKGKKFKVVGSQFQAPIINQASEIGEYGNFLIDESSTFHINKFQALSGAQVGEVGANYRRFTLFSARTSNQGEARDTSERNFINKATYIVDASDSSTIRITDGYTTYFVAVSQVDPDTIKDFRVHLEGGKYYIPDNTSINYQVFDSEVFTNEAKVFGKGVSFQYTPQNGQNTALSPLANKLSTNTYIQDYKHTTFNTGIFNMNGRSNQIVTIGNMYQNDTISLIGDIGIQSYRTFVRPHTPSMYELSVNYVDTLGNTGTARYKIGLANSYRGWKFQQSTGLVVDVTATQTSDNTYIIKPNLAAPFELIVQTQASGIFKWFIRGASDLRSATLILNASQNYNVNNEATGTTPDAAVSWANLVNTSTATTATATIPAASSSTPAGAFFQLSVPVTTTGSLSTSTVVDYDVTNLPAGVKVKNITRAANLMTIVLESSIAFTFSSAGTATIKWN